MNRVQLIGHLGKDPEIRSTTSGKTVASFSVATQERARKGSDEDQPPEWHSIVCFDKTAEWIGENLHKGDKVFVEGKIQTRKWQDKNGNDRSTTEVIAFAVERMARTENSGGGTARTSAGSRAKDYGRPAGGKPAEDEDLPF